MLHYYVTEPAARAARIFKTARFARAARQAHIGDDELCKAIKQIMSLFAKNNRDNIDVDELEDFRRLAHDSEQLTDKQLLQLLNDEDLNEICYERAKV